jgi:hypothetical protein
MVIYYISHLISFRHGLNFEESRDASAFLMAIEGMRPYRDFAWIYGPFSFFVYPFIMKIFGETLTVLRASYMVLASLVIPITYLLARRIMPPLWAGIAAFLSIVFFDIPYYTYNHVFVTLGGLAGLLMVCRFIEGKSILNLFLAGIFSAVALLTKPLLMGACPLIAISLFLLIRKQFKGWFIFSMGVGTLVAMYFYSNIGFQTYPYLAKDSTIMIAYLYGGYLPGFTPVLLFFNKLKELLPISAIMSSTNLKQTLVGILYNFTFFLPFIVSIVLFCFRKRFKGNVRQFLLVFVIFSICMSFEGLRVPHLVGRAYSIQVPFILITYILYLTKARFPRVVIALFLFSLSFLHIFRYPYSMIKKYTETLTLERGGGIRLTLAEKKLYESLTFYLSDNFKEGKIVTIGFGLPFSMFSFLSRYRDVFQDNEYVFKKLKFLIEIPNRNEKVKSALNLLENKILHKIKQEKPKAILFVIDDYTKDFNFLTPRIRDYINKNYSFAQAFGPADIHGLGGEIGWVMLYKQKGTI